MLALARIDESVPSREPETETGTASNGANGAGERGERGREKGRGRKREGEVGEEEKRRRRGEEERWLDCSAHSPLHLRILIMVMPCNTSMRFI